MAKELPKLTRPVPPIGHNTAHATPQTQERTANDMIREFMELVDRWRGPAPTGVTLASQENQDSELQDMVEENPFVDPSEFEDRRNRSRKVYTLTVGATEHTADIPARPSACRRVFRYLQKYEIGTVKQMAATMGLERKTIGNALSALKLANLVDAIEIPRS